MTATDYLPLNRRRFESNRGTIPGDSVPWELDDKETGLRWARDQGYRTTEFLRRASAREAVEDGLARWGKVVLKQPNSHSHHGVYMLERTDTGALFDHLRLRRVPDLDDMPIHGQPPPYWLAEQWVDSGMPGAPIPPDYKIFCFRGRISHIWQVDRVVAPARLATFDGAFFPLELGRHFTAPSTRLQRGWHRLPIHARAMLEMARTLSLRMDMAFVRIDCFDGPDGPLVGEITFASGLEDKGGFLPSPMLASIIDDALHGRGVRAASGFDIDLDRFWSMPHPARDFTSDAHELRVIQTGALSGDRQYPGAARRRLRPGPGAEVLELSLRTIAILNGEHRGAYDLQEWLAEPRGVIRSPARREEFRSIAREFHAARAHNVWHARRAAELTAEVVMGDNG